MTAAATIPTEYDHHAWAAYMRSLRGKWSVDPVHNGTSGRLLAFRPDQDDATRGAYVELDTRTGKCSAGRYEDAVPHLGDALFLPRWSATFPPTKELAARMFVRLGLGPSVAHF